MIHAINDTEILFGYMIYSLISEDRLGGELYDGMVCVKASMTDDSDKVLSYKIKINNGNTANTFIIPTPAIENPPEWIEWYHHKIYIGADLNGKLTATLHDLSMECCDTPMYACLDDADEWETAISIIILSISASSYIAKLIRQYYFRTHTLSSDASNEFWYDATTRISVEDVGDNKMKVVLHGFTNGETRFNKLELTIPKASDEEHISLYLRRELREILTAQHNGERNRRMLQAVYNALTTTIVVLNVEPETVDRIRKIALHRIYEVTEVPDIPNWVVNCCSCMDDLTDLIDKSVWIKSYATPDNGDAFIMSYEGFKSPVFDECDPATVYQKTIWALYHLGKYIKKVEDED